MNYLKGPQMKLKLYRYQNIEIIGYNKEDARRKLLSHHGIYMPLSHLPSIELVTLINKDSLRQKRSKYERTKS